MRLQPGAGSGQGSGFFAFVDAAALRARSWWSNSIMSFAATVRWRWIRAAATPLEGCQQLAASRRFGGGFLPGDRNTASEGFTADYRIGNLALGRILVSTSDKGDSGANIGAGPPRRRPMPHRWPPAASSELASISLIQPVDLYSRVDRATKYGFLFIGFTFMALLMFDIIGGVRVSAVEYLLMGAAIVLFFVLLLAFAEVIGFTAAYVVASAAIAGLNTAYSAAVLGSWKRGYVIGGLLIGLYAVLYILLGLEAFSLLIGSVLLFVALAGVMYATRRIDWSGTAAR